MGEVKKDTAAAFWLAWINKNLSAAECKNQHKEVSQPESERRPQNNQEVKLITSFNL